MYEYFIADELFTAGQPGFLLDNYCTIQLLGNNTWNIKPFDESPTIDVRGAFLNIFKAFDKV